MHVRKWWMDKMQTGIGENMLAKSRKYFTYMQNFCEESAHNLCAMDYCQTLPYYNNLCKEFYCLGLLT